MTYGERASQSGKPKIANKSAARPATLAGRLAGAGDVRLIFFGNERLATAVATKATTLRALVHSGYDVAAVVASHTPGVSRTERQLEIVEIAHAYHIPVLLPEKLNEVADKLKSYQAEAAILVAYGKIIPQSIIDIFPKGIINIHPSLLPQYRGPTPIETAILESARKTGVSLMSLVAKMDAGPLFAQEKVALSGQESKQELADRLLEDGSRLLLKNLSQILKENIKPRPQDESKATYTKLLKKGDDVIDWGKPAEAIEREVRAYLGFPRSRTKIASHEVIITKVRVSKDKNDGPLVMKANPGYLEILELIALSGRKMSGADFLHGYSPSENK